MLSFSLSLSNSISFLEMGEAQAQPIQVTVQKSEDGVVPKTPMIDDHQRLPQVSKFARFRWWLRMTVFTIFVLAGQSVGNLLGRLYFDKGGNSKWMATLVQTAGFPILLPFLFLYPTSKQSLQNHHHTDKPRLPTLVSLYLFLGIFVAGNCMLYTIGLAYLTASTFSLICASQLAFNAFFSYFLNAQKFTPFIVNSLVLLTISSVLLVFQNDEKNSATSSEMKYAIGFVCTVAASCTFGLLLSMTQFAFRKILKSTTFRVIFDMTIYQAMVATVVILIGLFASKEWESINGEMEGYKLGKVSYVMNLVWTAISWQIFSIGMVGMIFEVSALFSNVISTVGLPIVPVCAVVFFHDNMNGVKVVAMLLAMWGFVSYIYQHYLDDLKSKAEAKSTTNDDSRASSMNIFKDKAMLNI